LFNALIANSACFIFDLATDLEYSTVSPTFHLNFLID
jgi:hypothetical protein